MRHAMIDAFVLVVCVAWVVMVSLDAVITSVGCGQLQLRVHCTLALYGD
jgi:hypothetical protein